MEAPPGASSGTLKGTRRALQVIVRSTTAYSMVDEPRSNETEALASLQGRGSSKRGAEICVAISRLSDGWFAACESCPKTPFPGTWEARTCAPADAEQCNKIWCFDSGALQPDLLDIIGVMEHTEALRLRILRRLGDSPPCSSEVAWSRCFGPFAVDDALAPFQMSP